MARMRAPRGAEDLLPEQIVVLDHVFDACREVFDRHGYGEIRTPLFEETALFNRSLGEVSDVVQKEMFTVVRGDTSVSFRPEGTAPVVRAYLEHNLDKIRPFQKLYYMGPMFRFERPQAGRQRQFNQIGVEAVGSDSPLLDVEVIALAHRCFATIGLQNYMVRLNSIGDVDDRARFRDTLKDYFRPLMAERCEDCQQRFERNVFRMLDCKVPGCQPSNQAAPQFLDHISDASRQRFEQSVQILEELGIPHQVDPSIVRGFDYYTHTVFEISCPDLGARDAVCGGGRYDNLVSGMGGPQLGAVGFAIGVTPTLLAMEIQKHPLTQSTQSRGVDVFVAPISEEQRSAAFLLTDKLRQQGLQCDTDYENKSIRALFKAAGKRGVKLMVPLGESEVESGQLTIKDLVAGEEFQLQNDDALAAALQQRLAK